jgi:hypothetical protein
MIIDEKMYHPPPPPYFHSPPPAFSEESSNRNEFEKPSFSTLPAHLLLQIVYSTFPQRDGRYEGEGKIERQRRNLHWLETSLRLVNKALFVASMHILRSTYLPAYNSLIRPPYTSDPFSSSVSPTFTADSGSTRRELVTLDLFIALLAHENVLLDATSLHLPREEAYRDLFDMVQPRSRLEDLTLEEGVKAGLIYVGNSPPPAPVPVPAPPATTEQSVAASSSASPQPSPSPTKVSFNPFSRSSYLSLAKSKVRRSPSSPSAPSTSYTVNHNDGKDSMVTPPMSPVGDKLQSRINPLAFRALSISFSPRRVALVYTPAVSLSNEAYSGSTFGALSVSVTGPTAAGGMKTKKILVEVNRTKDEQLEVAAKRLIEGLEKVLTVDEV